MRFDLVIFDCDGVLVDSEPIANRIFCERLAEVGLRLSVQETMRTFMGRTKEGCIDLATQLLGHELPQGFVEAWDAALFEALEREVRAIDGVAEFIRSLAIPFCVATNSTPERLRVSLRASGLFALFEGRMFSAVDVPHPKPAPDLFLHAARSMQAAPARCVVIEDSPTGARAGVAAGMTVFGYAAAAYSSATALEAEGATPFSEMRKLAHLLS